MARKEPSTPRGGRQTPPPMAQAYPSAAITPERQQVPAVETTAAPSTTRERPPRRERSVNITPVERAISVAAGSFLTLYGLTRRRSWLGTPITGLGGLLFYRGATGHSYVYERIGIERAGQPVEVIQSVTVYKPPEEVYAFWRKLENLPKFMRHLESVKQVSDTRSHWIAQTAATGRALEWDAEITEDRPNELIRWRSLPNSSIQHAGEVRFQRAPGDRGTEVHVRMEYRPPMGMAVAAIAYPFTKQMLSQEIRRLKQVLEAGEIATTEGQPSGIASGASRQGGGG